MSPGDWWSGATERLGAREIGNSLAGGAWPLLQAALGAMVAWIIAQRIGDHPDPFFAPIAAMVALNAPPGERGLQAVRLLLGVMLGIAVGETAAALLGMGFGRVGLATFTAMLIAHVAGGARIVVIQAGAGAILTVIAADGEAGADRLLDAAIGGGVALFFSQVLFSPEPVSLLRRAETAALNGIAGGLDVTARALETGDADLGERGLKKLREIRDRLGELARLRKASRNVARRSAIWRSQRAPLVRERENADHLDLLGSSCVMLARTALAIEPAERDKLSTGVRALADSLSNLAKAPGDREVRQHAADRCLAIASSIPPPESAPDTGSGLSAAILRLVATDVMVFAGVDPVVAAEAIREGSVEFKVPAPPATPRTPFGLRRWRKRWKEGQLSGKLPRRKPDAAHGDSKE